MSIQWGVAFLMEGINWSVLVSKPKSKQTNQQGKNK